MLNEANIEGRSNCVCHLVLIHEPYSLQQEESIMVFLCGGGPTAAKQEQARPIDHYLCPRQNKSRNSCNDSPASPHLSAACLCSPLAASSSIPTHLPNNTQPLPSPLHSNRRAERIRPRRATQTNPQGRRIISNLLTPHHTRRTRHRTGHGHRNRHGARIPIRTYGNPRNSAPTLNPAQLGLARIARLPLQERRDEIRLLERDHGPVDEPDEFLHDDLDPRLEDGDARRDAVDGDGGDALGAQIGLVEHEAVVVEAEEVAHRVLALHVEEVLERAAAGRGVDPFLGGAFWRGGLLAGFP